MLSLEDILTTLSLQRSRLQTEYGVNRIGVFGSYARGDNSPQSDIDFIVEFADSVTDLFETKYKLRLYLSDLFNKPIDLANLKALKPYVLTEISPEIKYA